MQRGFVAALVATGSPARAARAIGKHAFGAEQLRRARGGQSFAAAWDAAPELARERELAGLRAGLTELAAEQEGERHRRRSAILPAADRGPPHGHAAPPAEPPAPRPDARARRRLEAEQDAAGREEAAIAAYRDALKAAGWEEDEQGNLWSPDPPIAAERLRSNRGAARRAGSGPADVRRSRHDRRHEFTS